LKQKNKIYNPDRPRKSKKVIRKCIATGEPQEPIKMIRFVLDPFGAVVPDLAEKLPGKGMWVTSCCETISKAIEKRLFDRSMKKKVLISNSLLENIEQMLVDRAVSAVGLARRAGRVLAGHTKIDHALRQGKVLLRIEAKDGANDGRNKLTRLNPNIPILDCAYGEELARAFEKRDTVHLAIAVNNKDVDDGLMAKFKKDFGRLEQFRKSNKNVRLENSTYQCIETTI
jgi:predicted RNA-binding protein YlxR (DUF448 family)